MFGGTQSMEEEVVKTNFGEEIHVHVRLSTSNCRRALLTRVVEATLLLAVSHFPLEELWQGFISFAQCAR